jgi:hypothetical protein
MDFFQRCLITFSTVLLLAVGDVEPKDCQSTPESTRTVEVILLRCVGKNEEVADQCTPGQSTLSKEDRELGSCVFDPASKEKQYQYKLIMKGSATDLDEDGEPTKYINVVGAYYRKCMNFGKEPSDDIKCDEHWPTLLKETGACEATDDESCGDIDGEVLDPGECKTIERVLSRETGMSKPDSDSGAKTWIEYVKENAVPIEIGEDKKKRSQVTSSSGKKLMMTYVIVADGWLFKAIQKQKGEAYLMNCGNGKNAEENENADIIQKISDSIWGKGEELCTFGDEVKKCEAPESSVIMIVVICCVFGCLCAAFAFYAFFHHSWASHGGSVRKTHGGTHKTPEVELSSTPMMNQYLSSQ